MGEMAEDAMVDAMLAEFDEQWEDEGREIWENQMREYQMSDRMRNRTKRYDVTDQQISDFLFKISTKSLCMLADKVMMDYMVESEVSEAEVDKIIDIASYGLSKKYLTQKQKWCLGAFIIYWMGRGKDV